MHILVVEDDLRLAQALEQILREQQYLVDLVHNGHDGLESALSGLYDVVILDVMLPGLDGFAVVQAMRAKKVATPVLLLTARGAQKDKVTGLDSGADDYMTKPFSPEELLARLRALTRRQGEVVMDTRSFADLELNLSTGQLCCGKNAIHLSYKELEVLHILMANPGLIVPKEDLIIKVWGIDSDAEDNNVEAYISFLRKKLAFLESRVHITTLRKLGYRLEANGQT